MSITPAQEKQQISKLKKDLDEETQLELQEVLKKLKQQMFNDYVTVIFH